MDTDSYRAFDEIISVLLIELYHVGRESGGVVLENLDPSDKSHRLVLEIANFAADRLKSHIYYKSSIWEYIKLRIKLRLRAIEVRYESKNSMVEAVDVNDLLERIKPIFDEKAPWAGFADIYYEYYKQLWKDER